MKNIKRYLSLVLALIMLLTMPISTLAVDQEVEESGLQLQTQSGEHAYNLKTLKVYTKDKSGKLNEVDFTKKFIQDRYEYILNLPRETKSIVIKAIPYDTKNNKVDVQNKNTKLEDFTYEVPLIPGPGDFNSGFDKTIWIHVKPKDPNLTEGVTYSIYTRVAGYPKPKIKGVKDLYIFEKNEVVTREDMLKGVSAYDELEGDLTNEITIKFTGTFDRDGWIDGKVDTRFLQDNASVQFGVNNSHEQYDSVRANVKIVKEKPEDYDDEAPVFHGIKDEIDVYVGDTITVADLLKGVTAIDNIDGDITDEIEVSSYSLKDEKIVIEKTPILHFIEYKVADKAGNITTAKTTLRVKERPVEPTDKEVLIPKIIQSIAMNYYGTGDDWQAVDLSIYGSRHLINQSTLLTKAQTVIAQRPKKVTEYERIAVSLTAAGIDVTEVPKRGGGTINLIDTISNHEPMGTVNDYIWALLAYDSGNYPVSRNAKWTRETLINYLLEHQLSDGSWNLNNQQTGQVDVDITAMAISALAPYKDRAKVNQALQQAIDCLGGVKTKNYRFVYGPENDETSESSSMVLIALASMGIDPERDTRFNNGTISVIDGLLDFLVINQYSTNNKYQFKHINNTTTGPDGMATEQAFRALVTYQKAKNGEFRPFHAYQFSNFGEADNPDQPIDPGEFVTLYDLKILSKPNKTKYLQGESPTIRGLMVQAVYSDGTKEIIPNSKLAIYGLDTDTWSSKRKVLVEYGGLVNSFYISVKAKETGGPMATIRVDDPKGRTYFPEQALSIEPGKDTAFSLLQKTGLTYNYNYHEQYEGVYVSSIQGLAEFDKGPNSGWMYRVNGVFPNHSASLHKLYDGDKVEWLYTRDLGKDLGASFEEEKEGEHYIMIRPGAHGQATPSGQVTKQTGDSLTVSFKPDEGYQVSDVRLNGQSLGAMDSYTFKDIEENAVLEVSFVEVTETVEEPEEQEEHQEEPLVETGFVDTVDHWATSAIQYSVDQGYFTGRTETTFAPDDPITRGEFVTILGRRAKVENIKVSSFPDVDPNYYYAPYISWASEQGIIEGYEDGEFKPDRKITREEMAKILNFYLDVLKEDKPMDQAKPFTDEEAFSSWAKDSIEQLSAMDILHGLENGAFAPKKDFTRAEAAQTLYNLDIN